MYLGEDVAPAESIASVSSTGVAPESASGGGWYERPLDVVGRVLKNVGAVLPGVAAIISAKKGMLYGPAAPSGGSLSYRYGYPDNYRGLPIPSSQAPSWLIPAVVGIGGVVLFSMLTAKRRR